MLLACLPARAQMWKQKTSRSSKWCSTLKRTSINLWRITCQICPTGVTSRSLTIRLYSYGRKTRWGPPSARRMAPRGSSRQCRTSGWRDFMAEGSTGRLTGLCRKAGGRSSSRTKVRACVRKGLLLDYLLYALVVTSCTHLLQRWWRSQPDTGFHCQSVVQVLLRNEGLPWSYLQSGPKNSSIHVYQRGAGLQDLA